MADVVTEMMNEAVANLRAMCLTRAETDRKITECEALYDMCREARDHCMVYYTNAIREAVRDTHPKFIGAELDVDDCDAEVKLTNDWGREVTFRAENGNLTLVSADMPDFEGKTVLNIAPEDERLEFMVSMANLLRDRGTLEKIAGTLSECRNVCELHDDMIERADNDLKALYRLVED